ncbi:unnamed protein product [Adineta ricciae]|uniref:Formate/nitrite transporter n=1 Tax=Adineta ricciae TaxID=249248 RepID=A0A815HPL8_ADIRI|nr:unnamed protein product [Adineta ricciae]
MSDCYNIYETFENLSNTGIKKAKQRIDHTIIKSILAGMLLSFAGLFLLTIGGGSLPLRDLFGTSIHKTIQALVFPVGLVLVLLTGVELFTGNTMIFIVSTLNKKTTWLQLLKSWIVSYCGNLLGCIIFQFVFVYYAGLLKYDPYRSYATHYAEVKGNTEWHEMFIRGIGGNWLVCLAVCLATSAREVSSKILAIYLPISLFIAVGFEHSIANMFTVQMGMILGANLSIGKYILRVLLPVTLGNIIGGGFFVGFLYWYLYLAKHEESHDHQDGDVQLPEKKPYHIVKQNDDTV